MALRNLDRSSSPLAWDEKWVDIFDRYQRDLRHAYYIRAILNRDERTVFEIAAGSFRDVAALRRMGTECSGMDFSPESVNRAKAAFPQYAENFHLMNAFDLQFKDKVIDVTYHNGFWVLFNAEQVSILAKEQARITRRRMIASVHNAHNVEFVKYFDRMKQNDPLYDIHFYTVEEISSAMSAVCNDVQVIPVGKSSRRHEDWLIKTGLTNPALMRWYLKQSGHRLLGQSERLMCVGTPR